MIQFKKKTIRHHLEIRRLLLMFIYIIYKKVCVGYSDLSIFVVGCAWVSIDQGRPVAVIKNGAVRPMIRTGDGVLIRGFF